MEELSSPQVEIRIFENSAAFLSLRFKLQWRAEGGISAAIIDTSIPRIGESRLRKRGQDFFALFFPPARQRTTTVFHIAGDNGVKQLSELSKVIVLGRKITNN